MPSLRSSTQKLKQAKLDFTSSPVSVTRELRSMGRNNATSSPVVNRSPAVSRQRKTRSSPIKASRGSVFGKGKHNDESESQKEEEEEEEVDDIEQFQPRAKRRRVISISSSDENEDDEDDEDVKDTFSQIGEAETSSDGMMNSSPMKKPRAPTQRKRNMLSETDEENEDETDEDDIIRPLRKRYTPKTSGVIDSQSSGDSDIENSHQKRRRLSRPHNSEDEEELEAEVDDLKDSSPINTPTSSRKDKVRVAMEKLKRRRERRQSGDKILSSEEQSDAEDSEANHEYGLGYQDIVHEDQDEYDDDFLDDENAEDDLEEVLAQRPIKFTKWANTDLEQLFSHAIEWLIQNKINPGFERNADIYTETWRRLNNEILVMAESKFKSSSWVRDFIVSLESRPIMKETREVITDFDRHCQACNRSGHPATYKITLTGKPYDPNSLEPLEQDESEYYDYDRDIKDRKVPHEREWFLGKTCFENSKNAHLLEHWRYSLNVEVMDQLKESGVFKTKRIVERNDWSVVQKTKYIRELMDTWEEDGLSRHLWDIYTDFTSTSRLNKRGTFQH
jgi:Domain of unknown function (DUF4211)